MIVVTDGSGSSGSVTRARRHRDRDRQAVALHGGGGVEPARTSVGLDVGTDKELLADPSTSASVIRAIDGDDYYAFLDTFVAALREVPTRGSSGKTSPPRTPRRS